MADPILSLTTTKERRKLEIDGQLFDVLDVIDLSVLDIHRMQSIAEKMKDFNLTKDSEEAAREFVVSLNETVRKAVRGVDGVLDKLTDMQKIRILEVFLGTTAIPKSDEAAVV